MSFLQKRLHECIWQDICVCIYTRPEWQGYYLTDTRSNGRHLFNAGMYTCIYLHIYTYICTHICIHIYMYTCVNKYMRPEWQWYHSKDPRNHERHCYNSGMYTCIHVCIYVYIYVYIYVCINIWDLSGNDTIRRIHGVTNGIVIMQVCIHVYMYVYMYTYTYMYMFVWIYETWVAMIPFEGSTESRTALL